MSNSKPPALQAPPIWAHPAPGSRRPKLTREQIATVALQLADEEGLDAVSMRRVAEIIGVGTMTLYYYVRTKDDLLALMDDAMMGEVLIPAEELPHTWREAMMAIAQSTRAAFLRHPWALHALEGVRIGPNGLKHFEQSVAALATAPLDDAGKIELIGVVDDFVFGHALRSADSWSTSTTDPETLRKINQFVSEQFATGEYPELARLIGDEEPMAAFAKLAQSMMDAARFERGLRGLLDSVSGG